MLDHYLAHAAFEGQFTQRKRSPDRPSNLFEPAPRDYGTHGQFDARARKHDWVTRLTTPLGAGGTRALLLLVGPLWLTFAVLPGFVQGLRSAASGPQLGPRNRRIRRLAAARS